MDLGIFFAVALGVGRRLRQGGVRVHPTRRRLLEFVNAFRGTNSTRLARAMGLSRSQARHHLQVLEKAGMVKRIPLGRESHYFPAETDAAEVDILSRAQHGRAWKIMGVVLAEPGITQRELGRRVDMTRKVLRVKLDILVDAGMIEEVIDGRLRRYLPGPRVGGALRRALGQLELLGASDVPGRTEKQDDPKVGAASRQASQRSPEQNRPPN